MSLFANIIYRNQSDTTDAEATTYTTGDVYIQITDENNLPANANYATVTVQAFYNNALQGQHDYVIPGQSLLIYTGLLSRKVNGALIENNTFTVTGLAPAGVSLPLVCDAHIDSVSIDKKESNSGAGDGQVTVNSFSSYGPITYSLDNIHFQPSATFKNLSAGGYTAYITDANGCAASYAFHLAATKNLLVNDPSVDAGGGNISRWSAAFNPIVFTYQRKDFEVTGIFNNTDTGGTLITVNGYTGKVKKDDLVFVNAGTYQGVYKVITAQDQGLIIKAPFVNQTITSGFLNSNTMCGYYNIATQVTYLDKLTGQTNTITSTNRPDRNGMIRADLSSFLQGLLQAKDESDYTQLNFRDSNLSASYRVAYRESWTDPVKGLQTSDLVSVDHPYYVTYSAMQLGEKYGGNMAAYVPFKTLPNPDQRAKWVTDFTEPAYSNGYPFDIGFIYSEGLTGLPLYYELTMLDINRNPLVGGVRTSYLNNDDSSYLLYQDGSKFVIADGTPATSTLEITPNQLGINRLLINISFPNNAYYFTIVLKYDDNAGTHTVTRAQTIRIDDAVDDRPVYLRWIGLTGSTPKAVSTTSA